MFILIKKLSDMYYETNNMINYHPAVHLHNTQYTTIPEILYNIKITAHLQAVASFNYTVM